jgi:hypothetical protein
MTGHRFLQLEGRVGGTNLKSYPTVDSKSYKYTYKFKSSMSCPDCTNGGVLPGEPSGTFSTNGAYYAAAPEPTSKRAVLLLTDVFGLALKNPKILADGLATRLACDVWVPDIFDGITHSSVEALVC